MRWARVWTCAVQLLSSRTLLQITITKVITFKSDSIAQGLETKHCLIMQIHGWGQSTLLWNRILRSQATFKLTCEDWMGFFSYTYGQIWNQSIQKETNPKHLLEGLMLKLKAPVLWPSDEKSWLIEKTLILGKIEGNRRRGGRDWDDYLASLTQWARIWANSGR